MSAKVTLPSRLLFDPNRLTQHQWTSSVNTDIRARFEALKRARIQAKAPNVTQIRGNQK